MKFFTPKFRYNTAALFLLTACAFTTKAQNIEGYVTDKKTNEALQNINIEMISQDDPSQKKTTTTDANGYYQINNIVTGIDDLSANEEMNFYYNANSIVVEIKTDKPLIKASLYGIDGRIMDTQPFNSIGANKYRAKFRINGYDTKMMIFSDGFHASRKIIPSLLPKTGQRLSNPVSYSKTKSQKSGNAYLFKLDDGEDDMYQALEVVKQIDPNTTNSFDFQMETYPDFFANVSLLIKDKFDRPITGSINATLLNGDFSENQTLTQDGGAFFENIQILHADGDKMNPQDMKFAMDFLIDGDYPEYKDTLTISEGDYSEEYTITPKQQEFAANVKLIVEANTGGNLENALAEIWKVDSNDIAEQNTDANGQAIFSNIVIAPINEITAATEKLVYRISKADFKTVQDTLEITHGDFQKNVELESTLLNQYSMVIHSLDEKDQDLSNVAWTLEDSNGLIAEGNTGSNALDTLEFENIAQSLNLILKSSKEEHSDFSESFTYYPDQLNVRTTKNELLKYLFTLQASAKDSETQNALDSLEVEMFDINGTLLSQESSLENTSVNLETTQAGHEFDVKLVAKRTGYTDSDTIPTTLLEKEDNQISINLTKLPAEEPVAYLWRKFAPEVEDPGTKANVTIENSELNYSRTITDVGVNGWWQDTVPVHPTGKTEYTITYEPRVLEGNIPLFDLVKKIEVSLKEESTGEDVVEALDQETAIKGKIIFNDTKENTAGGVDIIIWNSDRTELIDSIRTMDGNYKTVKLPAGFKGQMDVHIPENHPTNKDEEYFGHKGIPIGKESENDNYAVNTGRLVIKEKLTEFSDSTKTYNVALQAANWKDPKSGEIAKVNPAHIQWMDGANSWFLPLFKWGEVRTYIEPESVNMDWPQQIYNIIENNMGISYDFVEVNEPISNESIRIESLEDNYLNNLRNDMGINLTTSTGSGITDVNGSSAVEPYGFTSRGNVTIRSRPEGNSTTNFATTAAMRELLGRMFRVTEIDKSWYKSVINHAMPNDLDTNKMVYDNINFNIIYNNRKDRINSNEDERIHSGAWTIRPNSNSDFYSNKTQTELYSEDRWKAWDSTNIPTENLKFFQDN